MSDPYSMDPYSWTEFDDLAVEAHAEMGSAVCGQKYPLVVNGKRVFHVCLRDAGHESSEDAAYREHGYEDRTPF